MNQSTINREEAITLLHNYLKDDKLRKHSYAVEAIMISLANHLDKNEKFWGIVGLLHDIDYEYTQNSPQDHGNISAQLLNNLLPKTAINAIKGHNYLHTGYLPTTYLDKALIAADAVSGLIIATALVMPKKTLDEVKLSTVIKKMNDSSFAKGCNRTRIKLIEDLGINLDTFLELSLFALKDIHTTLDL